MAFTTRCPFNELPTQRLVDQALRAFGRVRRLQRAPVVAYALGLSLLAPATTVALELGEASIKSALGESLLVEIPYRLAANEQLTAGCVALVPSVDAADALPTYIRVRRISISSSHIEIFDDNSVREPLIGLNVDVHCATAAHFTRSYQLLVDPRARLDVANRADVFRARNAAGDSAASAPITRTARANASPRARGYAGGNLTQGQTYRVVRGDTLSGIAARVAERTTTIRQTADAIFAANPSAFTRGNPDMIEEGRSITIPNTQPATAMLRALSTPAPLPAVLEDELPADAPVPRADVAPAPSSAPQPLRAEDAASVDAPVAIEPLPAAAAVVEASAAPVVAATHTEVAPDEAGRTTTGRTSTWLTALLAVGVVILLAAPLAFLRRRKQQAEPRAAGKVQKSRPRQPVDPVAGIDVVEGRLAPVGRSKVDPATDSGVVSPAGLNDLALTIGPTDSVDLDVGTPIEMNERVDWFADRADAAATDAAGGDATIEENGATTRMPDLDTAVVDDEQMTLTIVELDMLRQDYETEHTLTQASQALRDALADLKATQAALAANAETSTMELPQESQAEMAESAATSQTARVRMNSRS